MRTLKFTFLILIMLTINNCLDVYKGEEENIQDINITSKIYYHHYLWLSFQNASGNNLLEGLEFVWDSEYGKFNPIKPEFYKLDIVYDEGIRNPWNYNTNHPILYLARWLSPQEQEQANPDYNYFMFSTESYVCTNTMKALWYGHSIKDACFAEKIIFRLTCPYLFGDNKEHDIVTWWKLLSGTSSHAMCYRVEYGGKEIPIVGEGEFSQFSVATIILDR